MTPDEIRNNYEFKIVRRALMNEYKWIKDVKIIDDEVNQYNTIFLDIVVDPIEMADEYGWVMMSWVQRALETGDGYRGTYPSLLFDIPFKLGEDTINTPMNIIISEIHYSPALPVDLRLPEGRGFHIGGFIVPPK